MEQEIANALEILKKGGIILYPTDTVWGIGCDATRSDAVDRIFKLKQRDDQKAMICLVNSLRMLEKHVEEVPPPAYDIIEYSDKPTTIIYDFPIGVAQNLISSDNSLGIRVTNNSFCQKLIAGLKRPLVSTSANISGFATPQSYSEIAPLILNGVDYIVNLHREKKCDAPSTIIKLKNDGSVKIIRN